MHHLILNRPPAGVLSHPLERTLDDSAAARFGASLKVKKRAAESSTRPPMICHTLADVYAVLMTSHH